MKKILFILIPLLLALASLSWADKAKQPVASEPQDGTQIEKSEPAIVPATPGKIQDSSQDKTPEAPKSAAPNFDLSWFSINGGGDSYVSSTNYQLGYSVGQSVAGEGSSASYDLGIGFWYGASPLCLAMPGDVNGTPPISLPDVVHLINYVFDKDRPATSCIDPDPGTCWPITPLCRGEINGASPINSSDIIYLINYVFDKDRPATSCVDPDPGTCWPLVPTETCCLPVP